MNNKDTIIDEVERLYAALKPTANLQLSTTSNLCLPYDKVQELLDYSHRMNRNMGRLLDLLESLPTAFEDLIPDWEYGDERDSNGD